MFRYSSKLPNFHFGDYDISTDFLSAKLLWFTVIKILLWYKEKFQDLREGGVQSTFFCIFNHCYFISSPNKLKICLCHTIRQLYSIYKISCKNIKTHSRKNFTTDLNRYIFCRICPMPGAHST